MKLFLAALAAFLVSTIYLHVQHSGGGSDDTLVIAVSGGSLGAGRVKAMVEPFMKETGIRVVVLRDQIQASQLRLAVDSGEMRVDVTTLSPAEGVMAHDDGYLQPIDYRRYPADVLKGFHRSQLQPWGVGNFYFGIVLGIRSTAYPVPAEGPATWADFWDGRRFPGQRILMSGETGADGPWEEALLADGVPPDRLYPLDIDRAFRSLDRIKPQIRKWWTLGSEASQLFSNNAADLGMIFDGRVEALAAAGKPVRMATAQIKRSGVYWVIPKGVPHAANAQKFIAFASRADRQAELALLTGYAPTNADALALLPPDVAARMLSSPKMMERAFAYDPQWYAQKDGRGRTNAARLAERWNKWIVE